MNTDTTSKVIKLTLGSKSLTVKVRNGIAKGTIQKNTGNPRIPGETTSLYKKLGVLLQKLSTETEIQIIELFGTINPKMRLWMRKLGVNVGFLITEDEKDGRTLKAMRVFTPQESPEPSQYT